MNNKEFFEQHHQAAMETIKMAINVDLGSDDAQMEFERLKIIEKALKQGNNAYKYALMNEIAKSKFENFHNRFLDEDDPKNLIE